MTRRICLLTTAFFSISSTAAAAAAPLQPIRPWNLDYGETQCIAAREYVVTFPGRVVRKLAKVAAGRPS